MVSLCLPSWYLFYVYLFLTALFMLFFFWEKFIFLILHFLLLFSCSVMSDPMDCSMPGFPVLHHLMELAQTHVNDELAQTQTQWCHPTISSSVIPFSSCLQAFPEAFLMSQLFISGGQSIGASASAWVLPVNIQDWFPLGLTGLIFLQSKKGLSRIFSNTTFQKHQLFGAQPSLWSISHIHTWLLEKTIALPIWTFVSK